MAKIINTSNRPYEWTFDGGNYGPLQPGEVADYPLEIAAHAVKRSAEIDQDLGDVVSYRVAYLDSVDKELVKKIATYVCPFSVTNQCNVAPFKTVDDLRVHLESHWASNGEQPKPQSAVRR